MRFGAFCPFPLPLGGDFTAAQHARLAADVSAMMRAGDFAIVTFTKSGSSFTVHSYTGQNGEGASNAPTLASAGTGACSLTWSAWTDPIDPEKRRKLKPNIVGGECFPHGASALFAQVDTASATQLDILIRDNSGAPTDGKATVVAHGSRAVALGVYGAAPDKEDSADEGETPYAWGFYQMLTSGLGDAYTKRKDSWIHVRKLALARALAGDQRLGDRLGYNRLPGTSDETLETWEDLLNVNGHPGSSRQERRIRVAAKYRLASGPTEANEDAAIAELLGSAFVRVWRQTGADLATPPTLTRWVGGTAGPASHDLGGGAWLSERRNLVVEVQVPAGMSADEFLYLMNVQLFRMLDDMLPSTATFNWADSVTDGFLLDISQLDYTGVVP